MAAEANELMGFAFRPGKDYKPLQIMDQYRREQANSAAAQAEARQKQIADSQKFMKDVEYNPGHINLPANKYLVKRGQEFHSKAAEIWRKRGGALTADDQMLLQEEMQKIKGEELILKATNDELTKVVGLGKSAIGQKIFNQTELGLAANEAYGSVFNPDGTLNKDWDPEKMQNSTLKRSVLNQSGIVKDFSDSLESEMRESISRNGGDITEYAVKTNFAKVNASGTGFEKDDNGVIKLNITPEIIDRARNSQYMNKTVEYKLEDMLVDNPKATYKDALESVLRPSATTEQKISLKTPSDSDGGDGSKLNVSGWDKSQNTTYTDRQTALANDGVIGTTGQSFEMNIPNFATVYTDDNGIEQTIKGIATRVEVDTETGKLYLKVIDKDDAVQKVEFTDNIYKAALAQTKNQADKNKLKENWNTKEQAAKNVTKKYFDEQIALNTRVALMKALSIGNSDQITNNVKAVLDSAGISYNSVEGNYPFVGAPYVKVDGEKFNASNIEALVDLMAIKAPKFFSSEIPNSKLPEGSAAPSTQQSPASNSKAEDLRKKYNY